MTDDGRYTFPIKRGEIVPQRKRRFDPNHYPVDCFPPRARDLINNVHFQVDCPLGAIGSVLIGICSLVCLDRVRVQKTADLVGPVVLWMLIALPSGERKTALLNLLLKPIREFDEDQMAILEQLAKEFEISLEMWADNRKLIKKRALAGGDDSALLMEKLVAHEHLKPVKSKGRRLIHEDVTKEALLKGLCDFHSSTGLTTDEFGTFFRGRVKDLVPLLCKAFDGSSVVVDRVGAGSLRIPEPLIALLLMGQPEVIQSYMEKNFDLLNVTGFLPRFLVAALEPRAGERTFKDSIEPNKDPINWFYERIRTLLVSVDVGSTNSPKILRFTPEAESAWKDYHDRVELDMARGRIFARFKAYASRLADKVARLSALMHYVFEGEGDIPLGTLNNCIEIVEWYTSMYVSIFGFDSLEANERNAIVLGRWLCNQVSKKGISNYNYKYVRQFGPSILRNNAVLDEALMELSTRGHISLIQANGQGGRSIWVKNSLSGYAFG